MDEKWDDFQVFFVFQGWNLCSCFATKSVFAQAPAFTG